MKFTFTSTKLAIEFVGRTMDLCAANGLVNLFTVKGIARSLTTPCAEQPAPKDCLVGWKPGTFKAMAVVIDDNGMTEVVMPEPTDLAYSVRENKAAAMHEESPCLADFDGDVLLTLLPAHEETVNHPNHYQSEGGLEVIDVIAQFTKGLNGVEAFAIGNAIKYLCRWSKKNGVEDLKKAKWYIDHVIEYRESRRKKHDAMVDSIVELMKGTIDKDSYLDVGEGAEAELGISPEMFEEALEKLNVRYLDDIMIFDGFDTDDKYRVRLCPIVHDPFIREAVIGTARECGCDWDGDLVFYRGKAYYVCVGTDKVVRRGDIPNRNGGYTGRYIPDTEETTA